MKTKEVQKVVKTETAKRENGKKTGNVTSQIDKQPTLSDIVEAAKLHYDAKSADLLQSLFIECKEMVLCGLDGLLHPALLENAKVCTDGFTRVLSSSGGDKYLPGNITNFEGQTKPYYFRYVVDGSFSDFIASLNSGIKVAKEMTKEISKKAKETAARKEQTTTAIILLKGGGSVEMIRGFCPLLSVSDIENLKRNLNL